MSTKNFDQDEQQSKISFNGSRNISDTQNAEKSDNMQLRSQVRSISGASVLILSVIVITVWPNSRIFANSSQPATIRSIPQATIAVSNYCNALVKHNFSQAQQYILPKSTTPSDLLQQEVQDAEEQNQGPFVRCTIFNGKDTTYPEGKPFFVINHKEGQGYSLSDPANWYTTKEVVSFQMDFFFQKSNAPTTYLTGSCQVLSTSNQNWLIYGSCPMDECPIPGWQASWGIGPQCLPPNVVGQPTKS